MSSVTSGVFWYLLAQVLILGWCNVAVTGVVWGSLGENISWEQGSGKVFMRSIDQSAACGSFLAHLQPEVLYRDAHRELQLTGYWRLCEAAMGRQLRATGRSQSENSSLVQLLRGRGKAVEEGPGAGSRVPVPLQFQILCLYSRRSEDPLRYRYNKSFLQN